MTYKNVEITGTTFLKAKIKRYQSAIENGAVITKVVEDQIGGTLKSIKKEIDKAYKQGHPVA
jgi:hypothetical protein